MMLLTRMLSDIPGTPGLRQQMPRTTKINLHAGLRGGVERVDEFGIDHRVHLRPNHAGAPGGDMGDFLIDQSQYRLAEIDGATAIFSRRSGRA